MYRFVIVMNVNQNPINVYFKVVLWKKKKSCNWFYCRIFAFKKLNGGTLERVWKCLSHRNNQYPRMNILFGSVCVCVCVCVCEGQRNWKRERGMITWILEERSKTEDITYSLREIHEGATHERALFWPQCPRRRIHSIPSAV